MSAEVLDKFAELITFALGLVAALAWNEAIQQLFTQLLGEEPPGGPVHQGLRQLAPPHPLHQAGAEADGVRQLDVDAGGEGPGAGLGLGGMAERARLVGGELDVRSAPGGGTSVTLRVGT